MFVSLYTDKDGAILIGQYFMKLTKALTGIVYNFVRKIPVQKYAGNIQHMIVLFL